MSEADFEDLLRRLEALEDAVESLQEQIDDLAGDDEK